MMKRLSLLLLVALIALSDTRIGTARQGGESLKAPGLRERVTVRRDERGIPYIEAANDHDLYFAQGYVTAGDRLWQIDLLRRTARGELAEIFGKVVLEEDKRRRVYGFAKLSERVASNLPPDARAHLDAYSAGVNAYITSCDERTLPVEFRILKYRPRPWSPADSLVIGLLMAESLSTTWQTDLMRAALADLPAGRREELLTEFSAIDTPVVGKDAVKQAKQARNDQIKIDQEIIREALKTDDLMARSRERVGLHAEGLAASNNWVVSGKRTVSGKPLLANDPHLAASVPSIWHLVHLSAPGVRVAGVAIPGINGVIIGHNERIAWGMTNLGPDVQDLYREKFDPQNPLKYLTPSGWKDAEIRREEINVRKAPTDPSTEIVIHEVTTTRHGPIVLEKGGERYALRWTVFDPRIESVTTFHKLNRARNWKEFTEAIRTFAGATQNFIYADVDGHIGYYGSGYIPIRKSGDGSVPYDGTMDNGEWIGNIPFESLPHVFDPPSGMIVTANARIVGRDYPHHLTHAWSAPYRQKRINDLLAKKGKLTVDDFREVQGDIYAIGGSNFAKAFVKLLKDDGDAKIKETVGLLSSWDGAVTGDSRAALFVHEMRDLFSNKIFAGALGEERARQYRWTNRHVLLDRIVTDWPQSWLPKGYSDWRELLRACEAETRASLAKKLGADESKWTFGQAVQIKFNHPLAAAPLVGNQFKIDPFPQQGNGYAGGIGPTVNVGPSVSMRLIADPSDWDKSQHGITLGQSGNPQSGHYKDQLEDWRKVAPRVFPFSKQAVNNATRSVVTLIP